MAIKKDKIFMVVSPDEFGDTIKWDKKKKKYDVDVTALNLPVSENTGSTRIEFTEREATVDLMINGIQLLFRELKNSNKLMCVTGVHYQGQWYGDSPDNEPATNPFDNTQIKKESE